MSPLASLIVVFASCFSAGMMLTYFVAQIRVNNAQVAHNRAVLELLGVLKARVEHLEQTLPEQDLETARHVN